MLNCLNRRNFNDHEINLHFVVVYHLLIQNHLHQLMVIQTPLCIYIYICWTIFVANNHKKFGNRQSIVQYYHATIILYLYILLYSCVTCRMCMFYRSERCYISCMASLRKTFCQVFTPCCVLDKRKKAKAPNNKCKRICFPMTYENDVFKDVIGKIVKGK